MNNNYIHKAGGLLIRDRKILPERHGGKEIYILPGGKLEPGETAPQALIRELWEEFKIVVKETDLQEVGSFESPAVHNPDHKVRIDAFIAKVWSGEIEPDSSIDGIVWVNSKNMGDVHISTIAQHDVILLLLTMKLID